MEKFLQCMPKRFEQLVFSIETLLNLQDLSINDVAGRFKVVEDREQASELEQGKLLYSEQWRTNDKKGDHAATSKDGQERRRRPRGGKKTKPKGDHTGGVANPDGRRRADRDDTCHNCNCTGHWAKDCPEPR